jgi:hypothetical protein
MKPYRIKADRLSRQAWQYLGKARELRFNMVKGNTRENTSMTCELISHQVRMARMAMGTAILYRDMDGRL